MTTQLEILKYPHDALKRVSTPVEKVDEEILGFCEDLIYTAKRAKNCAGLAAPQVGVNLRIIVVFFEKKKPLLMINPKLLAPEEVDGIQRTNFMQTIKEGCLSFPGTWREISRPNIVGIQYEDINLKPTRRLVTGFFSSLVQHEIDHLDGVVFTQRKSMRDLTAPQRG